MKMPMKYVMHTLLFACIALCVHGCGVSPEQLEGADFGSPPAGYQSKIQAYFDNSLKDPMSARYKYGTPYKVAANKGLWGAAGHAFGYAVDFTINAKNSFGGYTGQEKYTMFFYPDGRMTTVLTPEFNLKRID